MTEFEAATIAFQKATLALQQGQLWAAIAIPATTLLVGAGQCVLIWMGLRRMDQANRARLAEVEVRERREEAWERREEAWEKREEAREKREEAREKREEARHAEAMARLDQQAEALRALIQSLERQGAALEAAFKGGRA